MSTVTFNIPFPAWDTISELQEIRQALVNFSSDFDKLPVLGSPRRITIKSGSGYSANYPEVLKVQYWSPRQYCTVLLGAVPSDSFGTHWDILGISLKWEDPRPQARSSWIWVRLGAKTCQRLVWEAHRYRISPLLFGKFAEKHHYKVLNFLAKKMSEI